MRKIGLLVTLAIALAACDRPAESTFGTASAATQFFGKSLVDPNGTTFLFNADGMVTGTFEGADIEGTFTATETEICSSYTAPPVLAGSTSCSVPVVTGDTVIFNRRNGSVSQPYIIVGQDDIAVLDAAG